MSNERIRINRENLFIATGADGKFQDTSFTRRPPLVGKIDGRARILRPLRPATMQTHQQPTTSTNSGSVSAARNASGNMHHSQSMPVLQSGNTGTRPSSGTPSSGRVVLTLPSNTTEKHVIPLLQWIEVMRSKLIQMRQKSKKALDEALKEHSTLEDLTRARDSLTEMANIYFDMTRAAGLKCRYNAVFDKRPLYKSMEFSIQYLRQRDVDPSCLFGRLQESMDAKNAIEKNIAALSDTFRHNTVYPQRASRLSKPPPISLSKHVEDANKGIFLAMEAVMTKTRGDAMTWKFKRISHPCFRTSKCLIEVHYSARRSSSDEDFVPCMKAVIVLKYGILEDLIIGGEDEDLYNQEQILHSKRSVYQEFTKSAKETILCSPVTKFTIPTNFAQCNNYIQTYVNCFSTKCYYCKKHLRQFMPPTVVTRESSPIICHKLCQMSQVP